MSFLRRSLTLCSLLSAAGLFSGCGGVLATGSPRPADPNFQGKVFGGQQPISGSTIQLYAVGSAADGGASTALLPLVTTDTGGNFNVTGQYTCPSSNPLVYITASGGNPGLTAGTNNSAVALMAVLGPCQSLTASTHVVINELTTVAAVFPLAPFMTSLGSVGASTADAPLLAAAFTLAESFVDPGTGQTPGPMLPAATVDPVPHLNTLANIVAACVNSPGGVSGDNSACGNLFLYAPATGAAPPTDTIAAMLRVANNPTGNITSLFNLSSGTSPFQPQLSAAPADLTPKLSSPGTLTVTPTVLNFPDMQFNVTSAPLTVTVSNNSASPAYATIGSIVGTNAADFTAVGIACEGRLDPGASCTATYTFTPSASGNRAALAKVGVSTAAVVPTLQLLGRGLPGTAGDVSLSATTLTPPGAVQLRNNSDSDITIAGFRIPYDPALAAMDAQTYGGVYNGQIPYSQTNDCPTVLPAHAFCTINIAEEGIIGTQRRGTGTFTNILSVIDSAASSPQMVTITKDYIDNATPRRFDFGDIGVLTTPSTPVSSTGSIAYTTGMLSRPSVMGTFTGPDAAAFMPLPIFCPAFGGTNCFQPITFTPTEQRKYSATLLLGSFAIPVTGTGVAAGPNFKLSQSNSTFQSASDNVPPADRILDYTITDSVSISNTGTTALSVTYALTGADASAFKIVDTYKACAAPVQPAQSCGFSIANTPHTSASAMLVVTDTSSGLSRTLPLSYTYAHGTYPLPTLTGPATRFPTVHVGDAAAPLTFTAIVPYGDAASFSIASPFKIVGSSTCAYGAATCQVQVVPVTTSPLLNQTNPLVVTDLNSGNFAYIPLTATVGVPAFVVSPGSLNFCCTKVGEVTSGILTSKNVGDGYGSCPVLSISGVSSADFVAASDTGSVSPGSECRITVSFKPLTAGAKTALLTFENLTVSVTGYANP